MLAETAWSKALALERTAFGDIHPQVAWLMEMLADVYSARGERDVARDYATRALEAMKRALGENALPTAAAFANRANVEQRASDLEAAAKDYARALGIAHAHPGNDRLEKALLQRYSVLLKTMHRGQEAREMSAMAGSFRPMVKSEHVICGSVRRGSIVPGYYGGINARVFTGCDSATRTVILPLMVERARKLAKRTDRVPARGQRPHFHCFHARRLGTLRWPGAGSSRQPWLRGALFRGGRGSQQRLSHIEQLAEQMLERGG